MKLLIAIILMVLTGVCFAEPGDYRLTKGDKEMIESAINDRCQLFKNMQNNKTEGEYIKTICVMVARATVYQRFDDIMALPYQAAVTKILDEGGNDTVIILNAMGVKAGEAAAKAYLGMNFE
ncbi:hypothetical protein ACMC74_000204 [Escherichia coli]